MRSQCSATITSVHFLSIFVAPKRNPFGPIRNPAPAPAATALRPAPKDLRVLDSAPSGATRVALGVRLPSRGTREGRPRGVVSGLLRCLSPQNIPVLRGTAVHWWTPGVSVAWPWAGRAVTPDVCGPRAAGRGGDGQRLRRLPQNEPGPGARRWPLGQPGPLPGEVLLAGDSRTGSSVEEGRGAGRHPPLRRGERSGRGLWGPLAEPAPPQVRVLGSLD